MGEPEGDNLCFTDDGPGAAAVSDELIRQGIVTNPDFIARQDALKQLEDAEFDSGFETVNEIDLELEL
jgi:hypothetical protein